MSTNETNEKTETTSPPNAEGSVEPSDMAAPPIAATTATIDQAALAQKVEALLGETDQLEQLARQEEAKLEARTGGRGKSALEEAASKRLADIGSNNAAKKAKKASSSPSEEPQEAARRQAQVAAALDTPDRWADFVQKNRKGLTTFAGALVVVLSAAGAYAYYGDQKRAKASAELAQAYAALDARIVTAEQAKEKPPEDDMASDGPTYGSTDERAEAAIGKFESVEKQHPGTGAAFLAELTRASVLATQGKYEEAIKAFEAVRKTPLGKADLEINLRAAEGIGAAHEGLAFRNADRKAAELDAALASYKELIDSDALGFAELGQYHTARIYEQQGQIEKAKDLYRALHTKLTKPAEERPLGTYLEAVVTLRLQTVDPSFQPPRSPAMGGTSQLDEAQLKKLLEDLKKKQGAGGPTGGEQH